MAEHVNYIRINTASNVTVGGPSSHVALMSVNVCTAAASNVLTINDATSNAVIATIDASSKGSYWFGGCRIPGGIKVTLSTGGADCTVSYV